MRKILPLSCITMALMLAGCGGSSNSISVENIDAQVVEDKTYEHTFADLGNKTPVVTSLASNGNVQITTSGFNYVPNANFNGADSATIEVGKTRYTVQFTVTAENDLPTIATTDISVSATSEIKGQVAVTDVDDENVAITLKTEPTSGTLTLNADGTFVFKNDVLTLPNLSFEVTLDDGHGETVDFTINLSAAYSSNEDKANYYYASSESHLKQAEARVAGLKDDTLIANVYSPIIQGYVLASLDNKAAELIDEKIILERDKAKVFFDVAHTYNNLGKAEFSNQYINKSLQSMLTYFSEVGIDNISRDDMQFYVKMFKSVRDFGQGETLQTALSSLNFVFSQLRGDEYTFNYGRLVTEQRDIMSQLVDNYLKLPAGDLKKETIRKEAIEELKIYVRQSHASGVQRKKIEDSDDQPYYGVAPFYVGTAVTYAMALKANDLAKDILAQTLSYYSDVNYDNTYVYEAKAHSANSLAAYRFPLTAAVRDFSLLYPNADKNAALDIYDFSADNRTDNNLRKTLEREKPVTDGVLAIENGSSINDAIDIIKKAKPDSNYDQTTMLTGRSLITHSLSTALFNRAKDKEALVAIKASLDLILTKELMEEKRGSITVSLGSSGCGKHLGLFSKKGLSENAKEVAQRCYDELYTPHFSAYFENDDSPYRFSYAPSYAALAQADLFFAAGDNAKVTKLLTDTAKYIPTYEKKTDQIKYYAEYGNRAMASGSFELALAYFEQGKELIAKDTSLNGTSAINLLVSFNKLLSKYDYYDSTAFIYSAENELRRRGYKNAKYSEYLKKNRDIAAAINAKLVALLLDESATNKLRYADDVILSLASNRQYANADSLLKSLGLGESDNNKLLVMISSVQALQEDFPGSTVASVDSDDDGKANFFAISATDDEKEKTDIELDNDADGDGIADEDDPTPLG